MLTSNQVPTIVRTPSFAAKLAYVPWAAQGGCAASPREVSPILRPISLTQTTLESFAAFAVDARLSVS